MLRRFSCKTHRPSKIKVAQVSEYECDERDHATRSNGGLHQASSDGQATRMCPEDSLLCDSSESTAVMNDMPSEMLLEIFSFLDVPSLCAMMASNRAIRSLLTSNDGDSTWVSQISRLFGMTQLQACKEQFLCLKDDLHTQNPAGTSLSTLLYPSFNGVNLPFLLSRIPENLPSTMGNDEDIGKDEDTGTERVCSMRANHPLPRPTLILYSKQAATFIGKAKRLFSRKAPRWSPFVAPYKSMDAINITPRLVSYFEITIDPRNASNNRPCPDCVAIGLAEEESTWCDQSTLPGRDGCSYAYHSDNGGLYHCSGQLLGQGPPFGPGDTVGMGIDYVARGIFVTKNGRFWGFASYKLQVDYLSGTNFYPVVGMASNETTSVTVNYGNVEQQFQFDLAAYCNRQQKCMSKKDRITRRYQF